MSEIALGTWAFAGDRGFWSGQKRGDSIKTIHLAVRSRITCFDTAYAYRNGESEMLCGTELARFSIPRESLHISTKTKGSLNLKASLHRLHTSYVDVWYLHWPSRKRDTKAILEKMHEVEGARRIGVCNAPLNLLRTLKVEALQIPCSLLWTRGMRETREYCKQNGIRLSGYSPNGMGLLSGKYSTPPDDPRGALYCWQHPKEFNALIQTLREIAELHGSSPSQIAIGWALSQGFDEIVIGARNKAQLQEDLQTVVLKEDEREELTHLAERLVALSDDTQDNIFGHRW